MPKNFKKYPSGKEYDTKQACLQFNNKTIAEGPFPLMQKKKNELIQKGEKKEMLNIIYKFQQNLA